MQKEKDEILTDLHSKSLVSMREIPDTDKMSEEEFNAYVDDVLEEVDAEYVLRECPTCGENLVLFEDKGRTKKFICVLGHITVLSAEWDNN